MSTAKRNVRTVTFRNNHCLAQCKVCDWEAAIGEDGRLAAIQWAARRHTQTTGHTVIVERSIATHYMAVSEEK